MIGSLNGVLVLVGVVLAAAEEAAGGMAAQGAVAGEEYVAAPGMAGVEQIAG